MNDLLAKISSYDLFNNLIPGAILAFFLSAAEIYSFETDNVVGNLVMYYFLGNIISRIGSILIEPILKKIKIVKYNKYEDFIEASEKDGKILILLESANHLRTLLTLMIVASIAYNWSILTTYVVLPQRAWITILCLSLAVLFLLSYRKQNGFIRRRVDHQKSGG